MTGAAEVEDLVRAVRPGARDDDHEAVFAAGAWTALVEPDDVVAAALVGAFGAGEALEALRRDTPPSANPELRRGFDRWRRRLDDDLLARAFRNAAHLGARLLVPGDAGWPAGLDDLESHAPLALWALAAPGPVPRFQRSVALVGSRSATDYGLRVADDLSCGLVDRGFAVVSGAAMGIDGRAHLAALGSRGLTVAVLAGGLDRLYPAQHAELLRRIARDGVVLSEMPCGAAPLRDRFLHRNRLIAAMSRATVVVEAALRSGAANTAAHAAQLGRPLGAVPGSVYSAASSGTHRLLREFDAVLVQNAAEVAELARDRDAAVTLEGVDRLLDPEDPNERLVLGALAARPRSVLDVAARTGLGPSDTAAALGMLALVGLAADGPRGWTRGGEQASG